MRPHAIRWMVLAAVALLLAGCSSATATVDQGLLAESAPRVTLRMHEFAFDPARIVLVAGETVELELVNDGGVPHDFSVVSLDGRWALGSPGGASHEHGDGGRERVHIPVDPGDTVLTRLNVTTPGEYVFYCGLSGHRSAGMEGKLVVD